ncbi:Ldh family oxidoreductase [Jannaschia seohaensis]|uniref:LDH2 family malate/lactate/ureidoglycolate dehydrogenase n=1 Tax=Jannaschia seohaensis TaxID=475081 RepID=A0A2Y9AP74_9RHOB|nr:Ldh family oxidoreductase [Jannaschia seohaensis]PWJ20221.1 LDH2 family malate/lactate/ureidoglycolate dehydrogenase [Jannaschia seohaensis]SSA44217.1 Malate/lactate/ureidoglycolate dehydrogenase, LDH2 family [Jannaschia seohaensis]
MEISANPQPIERLKLSEQAREAIRSRIISGEFPMGEKLTESGLVRLLGVSKSPIREALLQLEREGLIVLSANRTTRVFSMGASEIAELGELRLILESEAMRLACSRNPGPLARDLSDIVGRMEQALALDDSDTYKLLDHDFHRAIFEHCGNSYVEANFRMLSFRVQALRNRLSLDPKLNARSLQEHRRICDMVLSGEFDRALALLKNHISETTTNYLNRVADSDHGEASALPTVRIALAEMERFSRAALAAVGADTATVDAVTRALMHASTLGVDTHGFRLLPHYLRALAGGRINRRPSPRVAGGTGAACVLDADNAHGALATYQAVEIAIDKAREFGIGAVAIRGSSHFGAAGAYATEIARQGLMGLTFCNSDAFVRLHGGAERFHGTNPIAAAAPAEDGPPWLLDMATSSIPYNRVLLSQSIGIPLPENVASDTHGMNVTDPAAAEMLAPLGGALFGYKGAGLAGLSEVLSSAFSDAPLSAELPPMVSDDMSTPRGLGAFVLVLDPAAFSGAAAFRAVMTRYLKAIRQSAVAADQQVMAPGDREWKEAESRRVIGLKLDETTLVSLGEFARRNSIEALQVLSADG